jgi:hypothetical protein
MFQLQPFHWWWSFEFFIEYLAMILTIPYISILFYFICFFTSYEKIRTNIRMRNSYKQKQKIPKNKAPRRINTNYSPFCRNRKQIALLLFVNLKPKKYDSSLKQVKLIGFFFQHFVFPVKINLCCHVYECKCTLKRMSH